jgi:hypothetical protein
VKQGTGARLSVLPWDFNVVKLPVLEFSEIVAEEVQWLKPWPGIQITLVSITPALQAANILGQSKFALEKFFLVFFLKSYQ